MFRTLARLSVSLMVLSPFAHAGWEKVYTGGLAVDRLPVLEHRGKVYMSTKSVLINSADGKAWDPSKGVYSGVVTQMISEGDTLWASTKNNGVQFTVDGAVSWKSGNLGRSDARGLVRMQGGTLFAATGEGVFRSRDNAKTWQAVNTGLTDLNVNCIEAVGAVLFAGTNGKGVQRSKDEGDHWESANGGGFNGTGANLLATDGKTLFAVPIHHKAVINSPDLGDHWNTDTAGMGKEQYPHGMDDYGTNVYWVHDRNVRGGVHITKDGGKTWSNVNPTTEPGRIERPKGAGFGLGYMFVGSESFGIWRRPVSELDLGPTPTAIEAERRAANARYGLRPVTGWNGHGVTLQVPWAPGVPAGVFDARGRSLSATHALPHRLR